MDLKENLLRGIYSYGLEQPSPVQQKLIPAACGIAAGATTHNKLSDCIAVATAGSGKTVAYAVPVLQNIDTKSESFQSLVLVPNRPLAYQVARVFEYLGTFLGVQVATVVGGTQIRQCVDEIRRAHVVVGTPGRVCHMIGMGAFTTTASFRTLVIDELEELVDQSFKDVLYDIVRALPSKFQIIAVGRTIKPTHYQLFDRFMTMPVKSILAGPIMNPLIQHYSVESNGEETRAETVLDLLGLVPSGCVLVFLETARKVDWFTEYAIRQNFTLSSFHEGISPEEANHVIKEFRSGNIRCLVTTPVLAQGFDLGMLSLIINYDTPRTPEDYLSRATRCGRFGRVGVVITLVEETERDQRVRDWSKAFHSNNSSAEFSVKPLPGNIGELLQM
eukprot:TRINITY_DN7924_c1_g1_i1.p1 TRINITY_DN7924_c1_g1~~TRINITY_DN7924_c1_g1_i1.p1  ORF type:complete len:452 (-),score=81.39 TRINITY_DN7924_c1_g1_i1:38-1204(-)